MIIIIIILLSRSKTVYFQTIQLGNVAQQG